MKKYWQLSVMWMIQHVAYPARVVIWLFIDIINFVVFPFIWLAIYGERSLIQGYSRADIVTYYIIIAFISVVATSHISDHIKKDILYGEMGGRLLKPLSYPLFRTFQELSYRLMRIVITPLLLLPLFLLIPQHIVLPDSVLTACLFVLSLLCAFVIFHCFELIVGMACFWMGENGALRQTYSMISIVLSGEIAPLVFFPVVIQNINKYLPFQYLFYFPSQIYLRKLSTIEIIVGFTRILVWIGILMVIVYLLWKKGVKGYDGGSL